MTDVPTQAELTVEELTFLAGAANTVCANGSECADGTESE